MSFTAPHDNLVRLMEDTSSTKDGFLYIKAIIDGSISFNLENVKQFPQPIVKQLRATCKTPQGKEWIMNFMSTPMELEDEEDENTTSSSFEKGELDPNIREMFFIPGPEHKEQDACLDDVNNHPNPHGLLATQLDILKKHNDPMLTTTIIKLWATTHDIPLFIYFFNIRPSFESFFQKMINESFDKENDVKRLKISIVDEYKEYRRKYAVYNAFIMFVRTYVKQFTKEEAIKMGVATIMGKILTRNTNGYTKANTTKRASLDIKIAVTCVNFHGFIRMSAFNKLDDARKQEIDISLARAVLFNMVKYPNLKRRAENSYATKTNMVSKKKSLTQNDPLIVTQEDQIRAALIVPPYMAEKRQRNDGTLDEFVNNPKRSK